MISANLLKIILKVIGILLLLKVIGFLSSFIKTIFKTDFSSISGNLFFSLELITIIFYLYAVYYFIFKTDFLINKFKLDYALNDGNKITEINDSFLINLGIIIVAGLLFVNEIPELILHLIRFFQISNNLSFSINDFTLPAIISGFKIILAYLLLKNRNKIVLYFDKSRKNN